MFLLVPNARLLAALFAVATLLFAGCAQPAHDPAVSTGADQSPQEPLVKNGAASPATPVQGPVLGPEPLEAWVMDDCDTWSAGVYIRKELHPATVPPEWRINNTFGLADIAYWVWDCHRVNAGDLERPLRWIVETHGRAKPPAACEDPSDDYWWLINRIWTDDEQAAAYLSPRLDFPIEVAPIAISRDSLDGMQTMAQWGPAGQVSSLAWEWSDDPSGLTTRQWAYYWFTEAGVARADFQAMNMKGTNLKTFKVTGTIAPGLLYHEALGEHFVGIGDPWNQQYDVTVTYYEDLLCEQPVGS